MAILKDGINGPFSGKVGSVVGYELNGQAIIRGLPNYVKRKPSPLALINRNRMKAVSKFLAPINETIKFGYKNLAPPGSRIGAFQKAQSYIFKTALEYNEDTIPYVNPEKVLVFRGNLQIPIVTSLNRNKNKLTIAWEAQRYQDKHYNILLLAYDIEKEVSIYDGGASTISGQLEWQLPEHFSKIEQLHIYFGVLDMFTGEMSDSVYAGCI
ncbi:MULTISPECIES: DUF6266 family protein [Sphingobacterium]|uniref:DUF6266 family protein n=1 Tax=Sphingobacterium TaxID=28453 RepID=UPI0013DBE5C2|nr:MULTISPECIES: DUF6266 family protein [unclassified Sphingobacterium]